MNKAFFVVILISWSLNSVSQTFHYSRDSIQDLFYAGQIVSLKDSIACYRLNGIENKRCYGYCLFDRSYIPKFTSNSQQFNIENGDIPKTVLVNSNCYTVIAPIFDYAQPFTEGWGGVCKNKKWTFVSIDGEFLCDYAFDAVYPFTKGKARVVYKGNAYEIDKNGNGIPSEINKETRSINVDLKLQTIKQLYEESQYEKTIEKGHDLSYSILCNQEHLTDISASDFYQASQSQYYAISAQNNLMATLYQAPELQDYYHSIPLKKRLSTESNHYELNRYNADYFFEKFRLDHLTEDNIVKLFNQINEQNYKSAIIQFEQWEKQKPDSLSYSPTELLTYYYLAELADDFETANQIILRIADHYETQKDLFSFPQYNMGVLLSNIKKRQSAQLFLTQAAKAAKRDGDKIQEMMCYYALALMYEETELLPPCMDSYENALKIIRNDTSNKIPVATKNEFYCEYINFLLGHGLMSSKHNPIIDTYVKSEIDFNTNLFLSEDMLHINKAWGKSLLRIRKYLQHLPTYSDSSYLSNALRITVFQQNIVQDSKKTFLNGINKTDNETIKSLWTIYQNKNKEYQGIDIFVLEEIDTLNQRIALEINGIEKRIKTLLANDSIYLIKNNYEEPFKYLVDNQVIIDVIEYDYLNSKYYGVFLARGDMKDVKFIPLCKEDRFSPEQFWPTISNHYSIYPDDHLYLFGGKLETEDLEYEQIENEISYFKYNIHRMSSLSNFKRTKKTEPNGQIALFGGLNYGNELIANTRGSVDDGYLKYSKIEIDSIGKIMEPTMNVRYFEDKQGTADQLLLFNNKSPEIIHLATHGYQEGLNNKTFSSAESFFYWDRFNYYRQNTDVESLEWLLNSTGLYLSINEVDSVNVITAREVASCDFSNSKLVVLSACNTISGEKTDSFSSPVGLTTSFVIAQVENVVSSLRNVNDAKSFEFMVLFYKHLKGNNNVFSSFQATVKDMYFKYPKHKEYWGSFVLLESHP